MAVKERLREFIKFKNITITAFCNAINVSPAYINSMRKSIQPDKIESIAINFPELSISWLLTGEGTMLNKIESEVNVDQSVMDNILEMFKNGEIFPKSVLKEKNAEINKLHEEIGELKARIKELEKLPGNQITGEDMKYANSG
jgi:hypothetical protein